MRTLQVINVQWYNATAWYAVHLARTLNNIGHPSVIVGIKDSLPLLHAKKLGLDVYELPLNSMKPKDIWACNIGIDKLCRSFKPDVVNCHRGESFLLWALKKNKYKYKLIRTRGDQRLPSFDILNRFLYKKSVDAIISTNSKMTNYFASELHIPQSKLHTILGGVDVTSFYPSKVDREAMRLHYNFTENDVVIGIIGRLDPVKGHRELLSVFADVCKQEHAISKCDTQNCDAQEHATQNCATQNCATQDNMNFIHGKDNLDFEQNQSSVATVNSVVSSEKNPSSIIYPVIASGINSDAAVNSSINSASVINSSINPSINPVINTNTKLHLFIVGGNCNYTIKDLCILGNELGIPQENLHCIGYVENMQKVMCMLDMGFIASLSSETIARVAFEMIACHLPIVGSCVGVMPDILDEKYLYEPYDNVRMAELLIMSKDPIFRNELLDSCIKRLEGSHSVYGWSLEKFAEKTLTVYRDC